MSILLASATVRQSRPALAERDWRDSPLWEKVNGVVPMDAPVLNPAETEAPTVPPTDPPTETPADMPPDIPADKPRDADADSPNPPLALVMLFAARLLLAAVKFKLAVALSGTPWSEK